jgi:hypothetical protein
MNTHSIKNEEHEKVVKDEEIKENIFWEFHDLRH